MRSIKDRVAARYGASSRNAVGAYDSIKRMTQRNQHSEAYVAGARILGLKHLEKKFSLIQQLVQLEGERPRGLGDYQYALYQQMMKAAEQKLSPEDYKDFYMSF